MFNRVIVAGNLVRNPEIRTLQTGSAVANSALAINRRWRDQSGEMREEVCFIDVAFWGRTAEIANQYLKKGSRILIEGRLKQDNWQTPNGENRSKHSITIENMQMLDRRDEQPQGGGYSNSQAPQQSGYQTASPTGNYVSKNSGYQNQYNNQAQNQENASAQNAQSISKQYEEKIPDIDVDADDDVPF